MLGTTQNDYHRHDGEQHQRREPTSAERAMARRTGMLFCLGCGRRLSDLPINEPCPKCGRRHYYLLFR